VFLSQQEELPPFILLLSFPPVVQASSFLQGEVESRAALIAPWVHLSSPEDAPFSIPFLDFRRPPPSFDPFRVVVVVFLKGWAPARRHSYFSCVIYLRDIFFFVTTVMSFEAPLANRSRRSRRSFSLSPLQGKDTFPLYAPQAI